MSVPIHIIKGNLISGDQKMIAQKLNCSKEMVCKVLNEKLGKRETKLTVMILKLAEEVGKSNIERNEKLLQPQINEA